MWGQKTAPWPQILRDLRIFAKLPGRSMALYGVWISPPILSPAPHGRTTSNKILFISVLGEYGTPYMLVREVRTRLQRTLIPRSEPFRLVRFLFSTRACVEYISHSLNS
jgi:hypothetical protein